MRTVFAILLVLVLASCGGGDRATLADVAADAATLVDAAPDAGPTDDLPGALPFSFQREDPGTGAPLSDAEVDAFSRRMRSFFADTGYFGWVLRMSHGVDASTGMRDFRLWWTDTDARKESGAVTIEHRWSEEHGGHNILKGNNLLLGTALSAYLLTGDPVLAELSEQYCKGMSSTMLGMVHDEADEVRHLMARNVIMSNHTYTTHDGREKSVDYSNWYHAYDRWNCSRFAYADNPYWGEVWVTNTRSKDGVGYVFWAWVPVLYAAQRAADEDVRAACGETRDLLALFTKDVVDSAYQIRTKDAEGTPYIPGKDTGPPEADTGDLAAFTTWDPLFPDAECNNKLAAELLAYGAPREITCTPLGGDPSYELLSIRNNAPNGHIMRAYHIAAIQLALLRGEDEVARAALAGLEERFTRDTEIDLSQVNTSEARWWRDLALNKIQAAGVGYPLSPDEVRTIQGYFEGADEHIRSWETWDLWADSVPDGEHRWLPRDYDEDDEGNRTYWMEVVGLGLLHHWCWSPFRNPEGSPLVNCDILLGRVE